MDAHPRASFSDLLKYHRLACGLSQEELAERAGLSREAISLLERGGRRAPHRDTLALLARTLKLAGEERARFLAAAPRQREPSSTSASAPPTPPRSLPPRLTSFIGREREIAEVRTLVLAQRLLTLTGPGGIGKTSLALAVAEAVQVQFLERVALVELAALTDGGLVPQAIAAALGVLEQRGEPILATLAAALGTIPRLLVLDNCEHLIESCARVAEALVGTCPGLAILATSREPLRIAAEVIWRVPPLPFPLPSTPLNPAAVDDSSIPSPRELVGEYAAVRLFVERAGAARPGFALTDGNVAAVAEICRRLDGIPLALELAAARVAALPPEQIARLLDDRFRLLTAGSRTALPRHQTLRALFDWSHDLLAQKEQVAFRRLAVFSGGLTVEAAQAVCGMGEHILEAAVCREEVLDLLLQLADKSLVLVDERDGEARFRLLETLREYAWEKLDASGEAATIRAAHAAYFATRVGGPGPQATELPGKRLVALPLEAVAGEADNLRAALGYFLERGDAEAGLALAARIYHFWFIRGPREEGREWLRKLLALPSAAPAPSREAALYAAGHLAQFQGDLPEADAAFGQAETLARARGDLRGRALARTCIGEVAFLRGELARARADLGEGVRLAREADAPAAQLDALARLGAVALDRGDLAGAREALAEGRAALPRFPLMRFRFDWLAGDLALAEGHGERAAREYRSALADRRAAGDPTGTAISALGLAVVAAARRDGARAARLLGWSEGLALGVGGQLIVQPQQQALHARAESAARGLLGEAAFSALRAEGRAMTIERGVACAMEEDGG
jgi:non-specific serine/threonine protein kinase